jgi:hypothetical protein
MKTMQRESENHVRKKDNNLKCALIEYVNNAMWKTYKRKWL